MPCAVKGCAPDRSFPQPTGGFATERKLHEKLTNGGRGAGNPQVRTPITATGLEFSWEIPGPGVGKSVSVILSVCTGFLVLMLVTLCAGAAWQYFDNRQAASHRLSIATVAQQLV